jgi:hypothetical protein
MIRLTRSFCRSRARVGSGSRTAKPCRPMRCEPQETPQPLEPPRPHPAPATRVGRGGFRPSRARGSRFRSERDRGPAGAAARLANIAAGIVVGKVGTAVVYASELAASLNGHDLYTLGTAPPPALSDPSGHVPPRGIEESPRRPQLDGRCMPGPGLCAHAAEAARRVDQACFCHSGSDQRGGGLRSTWRQAAARDAQPAAAHIL